MPPSTGNIDIHIHAILTPLRGSAQNTANQGQGSTDAAGLNTPSTSAPNTTNNTVPDTSSPVSASGASAIASPVSMGLNSGSTTHGGSSVTNMNSVNTSASVGSSTVVSSNTGASSSHEAASNSGVENSQPNTEQVSFVCNHSQPSKDASVLRY